MSQLLTSEIWNRICSAVKRQPSKCFVAVAYFGSGATRLLPLKKGSTLIVDMSEPAVRCGQTNPSEVLKLVKANVEVHSVENLHAKVFTAGKRAFVGSTNASHNSESALIEAAIETEHPQLVRACRDFVRSLRGELITPAYARRMQRIYRPPRPGVAIRRVKENRDVPAHSRLWAVPLEYVGWQEREYEAADTGRPKAKRRLRSPRNSRIDEFSWTGSNLVGRIRSNELLIQVTDESAVRQLVSPFGRVLHVEEYRHGRARSGIVFLEVPKDLLRKSQTTVVAKLGREAGFLGQLKGPLILKDRAFVHSLLNLWSRHKA